jgi:competence protein ComEC
MTSNASSRSARRGPAGLLRTRAALLALLPLLLWGCGGDGPSDPAAAPPEIVVTGVEDGGEYEGAVTIQVQVSPADAAVSIELNGERFTSGSTVTTPGDYLLRVEASRGGRQAEQVVAFRILLSGDRRLIVRLLDLGSEGLGGGGDAIILTDSSSAGMFHGVVDAGPRGEPGGPLVDEWVRDRLLALGVDTLEFLQLTHAHADHFRGMRPILEGLHVRRFVYNGQVRSFFRYQEVLSAANQHADTVMVLAQPWTFDLGPGEGAVRTVHLPGLSTWLGSHTDGGTELNEGSVGTQVTFQGVRLFLTGDGEDLANQRWRTSFASLTENLDIVKVGHHGANNAIFDDRVGTNPASAWLDHTRPRLFLVSSNGVSHPRVRALNRILGVEGADAYCTNVHGTITVRIAGGAWTVDVERNADQQCVPGSDANT